VTCSTCSGSCSCGGASLPPGCQPGGPSPEQPTAFANTQPLDSLACSPIGQLQSVVDLGRRFAHIFGARPYRVRMVWQRQDSITSRWSEAFGLELVPVDVSLGGFRLEDLAAGQVPGGSITLTEVSPIQVDELTLRGYLQGEAWGADEPTREFFFEVQQIPRCPTDPEPERYRFVLEGVPELRADRHEWRVRLVAQFGRRSRDGEDSTVPGEMYPTDGARFVP
jgi:hypothetical protein